MRRRILSALGWVKTEMLAVVLVFWVIQFVGWLGMMIYVQFFDRKLGESVVYVTQISHWALVETAFTAAVSTWALIQSKHNARKLQSLQHHRGS